MLDVLEPWRVQERAVKGLAEFSSEGWSTDTNCWPGVMGGDFRAREKCLESMIIFQR